mmetsp:Transcript_33129/g.61040  ORF Transcript_33129/g.61040 Transcript_33129/m.61040 type:complete len:203 (-) Transcript_33129:59-667(-)
MGRHRIPPKARPGGRLGLRPGRRLRIGHDVRRHIRLSHRQVRPAGDQPGRHPRSGRDSASDSGRGQEQGHGDGADGKYHRRAKGREGRVGRQGGRRGGGRGGRDGQGGICGGEQESGGEPDGQGGRQRRRRDDVEGRAELREEVIPLAVRHRRSEGGDGGVSGEAQAELYGFVTDAALVRIFQSKHCLPCRPATDKKKEDRQ